MSNPPLWGRGTKGAVSGLPSKGSQDESLSDKKETRRARSAITKSQARTQQAINDAQQGLQSLLDPQTDQQHPHIISPSGATRSHKRSRVAGPSPAAHNIPTPTHANGNGHLLPSEADSPRSVLSVRQDESQNEETRPIAWPDRTLAVRQAAQGLQTARERAQLLVSPLEDAGALGFADAQTAHISRRAAAQWITRYATHLIILLVVGVLVAFGGLKAFTTQGAYPHGLAAVDAFTGTDYVEDEHNEEGGAQDHDSQDFTLTLPRTELGNADDAANSATAQPDQEAAQPAGPEAPAAEQVTQYSVANGDTIESIADKFQVMPETIMGSNGIFDSEEDLAPGRTLVVPPIDGMYYVPNEGDTLESVAQRFQVDPADIAAYAGNGIGADGALKPGQPLIVPGGMMPERETVVSYTVKRGDILKEIAARFGVDVPTMLNSNDIPDPDNLQPGMQLRILPVPGMEYKIKKGDTVEDIADRLGVSPQMILDYTPNNLTVDSVLQIGQVIMVPGGSPEGTIIAAARVAPRDQPSARGIARPPERQQPQPQPQPKSQPKSVAKPAGSNSPKVGTGKMIWPVNGVITQYFTKRHNGLDIAIRAGTPIHAADSGKVIWSGWRTDGLGYCVMIDHQNGLLTVYGHMIRQPPVYVGQYVSRGQVIGYIGSTGHSTGPHVHFMVKVGMGHNYRNPLAYLGR